MDGSQTHAELKTAESMEPLILWENCTQAVKKFTQAAVSAPYIILEEVKLDY